MQIVREVTAESIGYFSSFLESKVLVATPENRISQRLEMVTSSTFHHFQQKCLFRREYRTEFRRGYDSRFGVPRKVDRCQRRREHDENDGDGREIENVCIVRRGLARDRRSRVSRALCRDKGRTCQGDRGGVMCKRARDAHKRKSSE